MEVRVKAPVPEISFVVRGDSTKELRKTGL